MCQGVGAEGQGRGVLLEEQLKGAHFHQMGNRNPVPLLLMGEFKEPTEMGEATTSPGDLPT